MGMKVVAVREHAKASAPGTWKPGEVYEEAKVWAKHLISLGICKEYKEAVKYTEKEDKTAYTTKEHKAPTKSKGRGRPKKKDNENGSKS